MFTHQPRTVFVLGAGASSDFEFPTGAQLFQQVSECLRSSDYASFRDQLALICDRRDISDTADAIKGTATESLDQFLVEAIPEFRTVAKTAACYRLLQAERRFDLLSTSAYSNRWYKVFWDRTFADRSLSTDVSVISFNYDRSLDSYLYQAEWSRQLVKTRKPTLSASMLEVLHVHGTLGTIDPATEWWRNRLDEVSCDMAMKSAASIYLYNERQDAPHWERIRTVYQSAERVIFLGFGFHHQNLVTLGKPERNAECLAVGFDPDIEWRAIVTERLGRPIQWGRDTEGCRDFVKYLAPWSKA